MTTRLILAAVGVGGLYELAVLGKLGPDAQRLAEGVPMVTSPAIANAAAPSTGNIAAGPQLGGPYADPAALTAANPNFPSLVTQWKYGTLATNSGNLPGSGGPYDWQSFQTVLVRLGYADPGPYPTLDFVTV